MTSQNRINNQKERIKQIHDIGKNQKSPFITQSNYINIIKLYKYYININQTLLLLLLLLL